MKKRLGPGLWVDQNNHGHIDIPELLQFFEMPDTPENHEFVKQMLKEILERELPGAQVKFRASADDPGTPL